MISAAQNLDPEMHAEQLALPLLDYAVQTPATLRKTETLRLAAERMGQSGLTSYPVLDTNGRFTGILNVSDLLQARVQSADREGRRHRVLQVRWPFAHGEQE